MEYESIYNYDNANISYIPISYSKQSKKSSVKNGSSNTANSSISHNKPKKDENLTSFQKMNENNSADIVRKLDIDKRSNRDKMNERNYFKSVTERNDIPFSSLTGTKEGTEQNLERPSIHKLDNAVDNKNSFFNNLTSTNINNGGCNKYPNPSKTQSVQTIEEIESSFMEEKTTKIRSKGKINPNKNTKSSRKEDIFVENIKNNPNNIKTASVTNQNERTESNFESNHMNVGKSHSNGPNFITSKKHSSKHFNANNFEQTTPVKGDYDVSSKTSHFISQNNKEGIKTKVTKDVPSQQTAPKNKTKTLTIMMNMSQQKPRETDGLLNSSLIKNSTTKTPDFLCSGISDTPKLKNVSKIDKKSHDKKDNVPPSSFEPSDVHKNVSKTNPIVTPKTNSSDNFKMMTRSEKIVPVSKQNKFHPRRKKVLVCTK